MNPLCARLYALVPLLVIPLVLALPFFFGQVLLFRDVIHFNIPEQVLSARALLAGRLPEWNPFVYGGAPFLAEPGSGVFYPPNWLFLFLDPFRAATAFVLVHLPLAAWGTLRLSRRVGLTREAAAISACAFTASGYLLSMNGGHYYFASAALLPLAVAALVDAADAQSGRAVAWGAIPVALLALNGELQALLFAALFAFVVAGAKRDGGETSASETSASAAGQAAKFASSSAAEELRQLLLRALALCAALALGAALGAVQLVPSLLLGRSTIRAHGVPFDEAAAWALHPLRLLDFLVPEPWGMPYPDNGFFGRALVNGPHQVAWAPSLWLGTLVPLLALSTPWRSLRRRRAALGAVLCVSLLGALGARTPLFALLRALVPLANRFRYPEKFALPATLAMVLLAGFRIDDLSRAPAPDRAAARRACGALFAACACVLSVLGAAASSHPAILLDALARGLRAGEANLSALAAARTLAGALFESALLCAVGVLACLLAARRPRLVPALFLFALAAAQTANGLDVLSYGSADSLRAEPPLARALESALAPGSAGRVASDGNCRFRGEGTGSLLERVRAFQLQTGHDNLLSLFGLRAAIGYGAAEAPEQVEEFHALSRLGGDAALRAFGAAARFGCDASGALSVHPLEHPLPRVRVALALPLPDASEAQARALIAQAANRDATALLAPDLLARIPVPGAAGSAEVLAETPEEVTVQARGGGGALVLADRFAEGWSARLDGEEAQVFRADIIYRAIALPPGEHRVVFRYRTPGLHGGALISLAALALLSFALARREPWTALTQV